MGKLHSMLYKAVVSRWALTHSAQEDLSDFSYFRSLTGDPIKNLNVHGGSYRSECKDSV